MTNSLLNLEENDLQIVQGGCWGPFPTPWCLGIDGCCDCFDGDTRILTPNGEVPIEVIVAGQDVVCWDDVREQLAVGRVSQVSSLDHRLVGKIRLTDGTVLRVTPNHPVARKARTQETTHYVPAGRLMSGDFIYRSTQAGIVPVEVDSVSWLERYASVYNFSVEWYENYFAEGMLVRALRQPSTSHLRLDRVLRFLAEAAP